MLLTCDDDQHMPEKMKQDYDRLFENAKTHMEARMIFHRNVTKGMDSAEKETLIAAYERALKLIPDEEQALMNAEKLC